MHLSEEALDFVGAATASPEVEMEPHLPPETNSRFHQGLHSIKLATLQRLWTHACICGMSFSEAARGRN